MQKKTYAELLKDPRWQKKRLEIMQRDNFTCQLCGSKEKTLNVHHMYYDRIFEPWNYSDDAYLTVCEDCHNKAHEDIKRKIMSRKARIGYVYECDHSDFTNYMLCYDIDPNKELVYLMGIDNGSGSNDLWFAKLSYKDFVYRCNNLGCFFSDKYEDNYYENSLFYVFYCYITGRRDLINIHFEEEDGRDNVTKEVRFNMLEMFENNVRLKELFIKALNDESFVLHY